MRDPSLSAPNHKRKPVDKAFVSKGCLKGSCWNCYSLACSHVCHGRNIKDGDRVKKV